MAGWLASFASFVSSLSGRSTAGWQARRHRPTRGSPLPKRACWTGKRRFRLLWNCAVRRRADQKAALGRGGKEHAAARQKHSLNSNAWMDYTPVQDMKAYETVLLWLSSGCETFAFQPADR